MGKYVITDSQLKRAVYRVLDSHFTGYSDEKYEEWVKWLKTKFIHLGKEVITHHHHLGTETESPRAVVVFSKELCKKLSTTFKIRMSKVIDIVGDYVEEVHDLPVDEVEIKKL